MSVLLGADTARIDAIAGGLGGYSQEIQDLRTMAQRAVAEMRSSWSGPDFEGIAQRWEQEAGPRLADASAALSSMASALRAQAEDQRQASGSFSGTSAPMSPDGSSVCMPRGGGSGVAPRDGDVETWDGDVDRTLQGRLGPVETLTVETISGNRTDTSSTTFIGGHQVAAGQSVVWGPNGEGVNEPNAADQVKLNLAEGEVTFVDESLASLKGGDDDDQYELSAGKVEAEAGYSADIDARGNLVASGSVSAAAYAGYAAGSLHRGNSLAKVAAGGEAYVGAEVKADASGSIGPDGAKGHLAAEAFAGGKAEAFVGGTLIGATAVAGAEISFGIGAHADADAEFSTTKIGVSADIGATLGLGAGLSADVSVNPQEVITNVGHAVDDVGDGLTFAGDQLVSLLDW